MEQIFFCCIAVLIGSWLQYQFDKKEIKKIKAQNEDMRAQIYRLKLALGIAKREWIRAITELAIERFNRIWK